MGVSSCFNGAVSLPFVASRNTAKPSNPSLINNLSGTVYGYFAGGNYVFSLSSINADSYSWTASAGTVTNGQGTNTVTIHLNNPYSSCEINVTAINCSGTTLKTKLTLKSVLPKPSISGPGSACRITSPIRTFSATASGSLTSFNWSSTTSTIKFSDGGVPANPLTTGSSSVAVNFSGFAPGPKTISVLANNICGAGAKANKTISVNNCHRVGDEEVVDGESSLSVYPNPANNLLNAKFNTSVEGKYTARMIDLTGRIISSEIRNAIPWR